MVTKVQYENGITTVQITTNTLKRLRILKAGLDYSSFDELINEGLNLIEKDNTNQTRMPSAISHPCDKLKLQNNSKKTKEKKQ